MILTERQTIALQHTCRLPEETWHPRFSRIHPPTSTVLTLNSGFE